MLFFVWCTWMSLSSCFLTPAETNQRTNNFFRKKKVFRKSALETNHRTNLVKTKSILINTFKRYRLNTIPIYPVFHRKWKQFIFKKHVFLIVFSWNFTPKGVTREKKWGKKMSWKSKRKCLKVKTECFFSFGVLGWAFCPRPPPLSDPT